MIKNFEKLRDVMVLNFFRFSFEEVLKKYGKWCLKMCGNPDTEIPGKAAK